MCWQKEGCQWRPHLSLVSTERQRLLYCNKTVNCSQRSSVAVFCHVSSQKHIEKSKKCRKAEGILVKSAVVQSALDFSTDSAESLLESIVRAETLFTLSVVAAFVPYTVADMATLKFPCMFPDLLTVKGFQCVRKKLSHMISGCLGLYFKAQMVAELLAPDVFYTIMID